MRPLTGLGTCIAIAAAALASAPASAPAGGARAAGVASAVEAVRIHTQRADAALDRALALFGGRQDRAARLAYATSRREMGLAKASAARARRQAKTPGARARAARAQQLLAEQLTDNVEALARVLPRSGRSAQRSVASAVRADTQGRERAIAVLTALRDKVPQAARSALTTTIARLLHGRDDARRAEVLALVSGRVSPADKRRVTAALRADVSGQAAGSATLARLIARREAPPDVPRLQRSYAAITREHRGVETMLQGILERVPSSLRPFVEAILAQAREGVRRMLDEQPTRAPGGNPADPSGGVRDGRRDGALGDLLQGRSEQLLEATLEGVPPRRRLRAR